MLFSLNIAGPNHHSNPERRFWGGWVLCVPFCEILCPTAIMPTLFPLSQFTMCPGLRHSGGYVALVCHWGISHPQLLYRFQLLNLLAWFSWLSPPRCCPSFMEIPAFQDNGNQRILTKHGKLVHPLGGNSLLTTKKQSRPLSLSMMVKQMCLPEDFSWGWNIRSNVVDEHFGVLLQFGIDYQMHDTHLVGRDDS